MMLYLTKFGQGSPLVFFHGWGFDSQIWLPLVTDLSPFYQLILVDLPGFGQSSLMAWPKFKELLLDQLPDKFALVGWSLGGLYATRLALEEPRVSAIMNISTSVRFTEDLNWPGLSRDLLLDFKKKLLLNPELTVNEFRMLQGRDHVDTIVFGKQPSIAGLRVGLDDLASWDLRSQLNVMNIPTCFLFGRLDPIISIKTMDVMQLTYPQFHYRLFKKSAHMPFLSQKNDFISTILGFIQ